MALTQKQEIPIHLSPDGGAQGIVLDVKIGPGFSPDGEEVVQRKWPFAVLIPEQKLTITTIGEEVLAGKTDWLDVVDIDCWTGGVDLKPGNIWCWNSSCDSLTKRPVKG